MRSHRQFLPLIAGALLALAGSGGATPQQAEPAPSSPPAYVGADVCVACHGEVADQMAATLHGKSAFAKLSNQGCETCHGPGSAHADDPENPSLQPSITKLSARAQADTCQQCHSGGQQFFWNGGRHEARGLSCTSCHSVHSPKSEQAQLASATVTEQCFSCHKDVRAEIWKTSHHPVREGKITCSDCHNPHGSPTPKMIRAATVNEQCYTCHTEKRGPFLWEHPPVRENCMNCHTPHGSNHLKLQRTSVPYLCQQCHSNTRHPGTLYDAFRAPTLENPATGSNRLFNRACLDCHSAIHGSNHPSSPYLAH